MVWSRGRSDPEGIRVGDGSSRASGLTPDDEGCQIAAAMAGPIGVPLPLRRYSRWLRVPDVQPFQTT